MCCPLFLVHQGHEVHIVPQKHLVAVNPSLQRAIFQFEHAPRTDGRADPATHTTGTDNILALLGVGAHIDAHFAIGGTVAAGNALTAIGGDPESGEQPLLEAQNGRHGATEPAPDPAPKNRVEPRADDAGENTADQKGIGFA